MINIWQNFSRHLQLETYLTCARPVKKDTGQWVLINSLVQGICISCRHSEKGGKGSVQQQEIVIQYYDSNPYPAAPYVTLSVLSYTPTVGIHEAATKTLPLAYLYPFVGAPATH